MRILAFMNQKGGVAKTTTTVNVGAALRDVGKRILIVDLDGQASTTRHLGVNTLDSFSTKTAGMDSKPTIPTTFEFLVGEASFKQTVVRAAGMDLIPAHLSLTGSDLKLSNIPGREQLLKESLGECEDSYDFVLFDCPPALGLLSLNAMAAATDIFIVQKAEPMALHGTADLLQTADLVKRRVNPSLKVSGLIITLFNSNLKLHKECIELVDTELPELRLEPAIRVNVRLAEASGHGLDIFRYDPDSSGAEDHRALAESILNRLNNKKDGKRRNEIKAAKNGRKSSGMDSINERSSTI